MSLRIVAFVLIVAVSALAFPQQKRRDESPVIFIDFNYDGRTSGGEKAHRSLDQVAYEDGSTRGRSTYKDSYGNPVAYDSLDDVDAQRPGNNKVIKNFNYVIPGYASGILDPNETPRFESRSTTTNDNQEARRINNDDRIHFVDHPTGLFSNSPVLPTLPTLSFPPPINDPLNPENIHLPANALASGGVPALGEKPINDPLNPENIHLPPNALASGGVASNTKPINDPLFPENIHLPPNPTASEGLPSTSLELPIHQDANTPALSQGLTPPALPSNFGLDIPRPNLNSPQSPIDRNGDNALNKGLLPPPPAGNPFLNRQSTTPRPSSFNSNQGPVIITDDQTQFAPKPSFGLQPPKDPQPDFNFQSRPTAPSSSSTKFTGTFTGSLDGSSGVPSTQKTYQDIPVVVLQSPSTSKVSGDKYQGSFGGSPGVLTANNNQNFNRVTPTQNSPVFTPSTSTTNTVVNRPNRVNFSGNPFLSNPIPSASTTNVQAAPIPTLQKPSADAEKTVRNKYQGQFGGPAGVLTPFDNRA